MAEVAAKDVAALRKLTGAGMMDCKRALGESGGDLEAAKDWLRKKGLAGAAKRAGRAAEQGAVSVVVDGDTAAAVELTCETDFVAKGPDFRQALEAITKQAALQGDADLAAQQLDGTTVGDAVTQLGVRLGERIELGRVVRYETSGGLLDGYRHVQNDRGTIAVLVELEGVDPGDPSAREVAHDVALHIASAAPRYVTRDQVTAADLDKEREVFTELTRNEGKPEAAIPKIVEGRMNAFYRDTVLLEQGFVKDPKTTVASLLERLGGEAKVTRFARIKVGED